MLFHRFVCLVSLQQKYFDSGDYAMAKAKTGGLPGPGMKGPIPTKGKFLPTGPSTGLLNGDNFEDLNSRVDVSL